MGDDGASGDKERGAAGGAVVIEDFKEFFAPQCYPTSMSAELQAFYPGELLSAQETLALADNYRRAAERLHPPGGEWSPNLRAPYRLVAIHAVELYLNALLSFRGVGPSGIRGLQHNLANRAKSLCAHGVVLRTGTLLHLETLTSSREYLRARYEGEKRVKLTELNRLEATLKEVAEKVTARIARG